MNLWWNLCNYVCCSFYLLIVYACVTPSSSALCPWISVSHQALLNLLLTGRANPHVFNGTVLYDERGDVLEHPLHGVLARSDVGYLHWSREQLQQGKLPAVGSSYRPSKPFIHSSTPAPLAGISISLRVGPLLDSDCHSPNKMGQV